MYFLQLLAFIILFIMYNSHSLPEGFCSRSESTQILRICTVDSMHISTTVYIDTLGAPKLRKTSCECRISPISHNAFLVFNLLHITQGSPLKFEIKGKVLDTKSSSHTVRIQENTKLMFITNTTREQEGACLAIYPKYTSQDATFIIHCKNFVTTTTTPPTTTTPTTTESTTESTTETIPVSNLTSQVTETMSKYHTLPTQKQKSTAQTRVDPENSTQNGSSGIKVPIVAACIAAFICSAGFVILIVIICRRHRSVRENRNNQSNEVTMSDLDPNTGQSECDTNTYEIPDQNVYEGLERQDNVSSSEMYQHLYTETKNPDCERHRSVKEKINNQSNEVAVSDLEPNTEQTEYDTNTYEIPDQNVYEGLDRQDNAKSDETYQHLYTETQNLNCEIKTQNLSNQQSDTNILEKEHYNTPDKDSICYSIHRENSSNEYESYKANATDQMYETLQKDN